MQKIVIAGKTINLTFNMHDWERVEDEVCTLDELDSALTKKGRIKNIYKLVAILAHDEVITPEWLSLNVQPYQIKALVQEINTTIIKALNRKDDDNTVHDTVLEEIQKNGDGAA